MTPITIPATQQQPFAERAVCVSVQSGRLGNRRKVDTDEVTVDADKDAVAVSKELLDSKEWSAIKNLDSEVRRYLQRKCLPSMFRDGVHLLPIPMIDAVDTQLQAFAARRAELVDAFCAAYPGKVEDARKRLRGLYNASDYPTPDRVRRAFAFSWQYVALGVPGQLEGISKSMFNREKEKAEQQWANAQTEIQNVLRTAMAELVAHMVERLTPDPTTGKPRVFFGSTVDKLREFLADFPLRNITDDAQLAALADRARTLLDGRNNDTLRTNEALRGQVANGMANIKATLDKLCIDKPARKIRLEVSDAA